SDQLIRALFGQCADAVFIEVLSMRRTRRLSIDSHSDARGSLRWSNDGVKVARVKPVGERCARLVGHGRACSDRPVTGKSPMIERELGGNRVRVAPVVNRATGRGKPVRLLISRVVLRRLQRGPIRGHFETAGIGRYQRVADAAGAGLA